MTAPSVNRAEPSLEPVPLDEASAFLRAAGLVVDKISSSRMISHVELGADHHTPWGIMHGGVYSTAIESAASIGASTAVRQRGQVAVGLNGPENPHSRQAQYYDDSQWPVANSHEKSFAAFQPPDGEARLWWVVHRKVFCQSNYLIRSLRQAVSR